MANFGCVQMMKTIYNLMASESLVGVIQHKTTAIYMKESCIRDVMPGIDLSHRAERGRNDMRVDRIEVGRNGRLTDTVRVTVMARRAVLALNPTIVLATGTLTIVRANFTDGPRHPALAC